LYRYTKVAARAEIELQQIVAERNARIVELKRQLTDKSKALHDAKWSQPPPAVAAAGRAAAAAAAAERETREARARADYGGGGSPGGSYSNSSRSGRSPTLPSSLRGSSEHCEEGIGGNGRSPSSLEAENAGLRAEKSRAEAEIERVRAEYNAAVAHAPTPEEMEVLHDEVLELRRRVAAAAASRGGGGGGGGGGGDGDGAEVGPSGSNRAAMSADDMRVFVARELQADVNAAVTAAAAALTGAPLPPPPGSKGAPPPPPPGSAAAAVQHLSFALRDAQNAANKVGLYKLNSVDP
jgi:hypothetical protein